MPRPPANAPCPCCSGRKAKGCCLPVLLGAPAGSPEPLMRSRYTAYASADVSYVIRTTHPLGPRAQTDSRAWAEELRVYCAATRFEGLKITNTTESGDHGTVTFHARLSHHGVDVSFSETSGFERVGGQWLYRSGERLAYAGHSD